MSGILLVVHQDDRLLWSHWRGLVSAAVAAGWEVHLAGPVSGWSEQLVSLGAQVHELPLGRSWSPVQLWRARGALRKLVREVRPDIAQTVHLRPTLVAGSVLRDAKIPTTCLIAGLGMLGQWAPRWVGVRLTRLFRDSDVLGQVQNASDADFLVKHGHCDPSRVTRLAGSGVDVRRFSVQPFPSGIPVVLFAGRLLKNKGIDLLLEASRRVAAPHQLVIAGSPDRFHPRGHSLRSIRRACDRVGARFVGYQTDMPALLESASVVCLPTWYPEGCPRILCEAAASGRPVIATEIPGCRTAVKHGCSGLLIPPRNLDALVSALEDLLDPSPEAHNQLVSMGQAGRALAEGPMREERVHELVLADYERLVALGGRTV